MMLPRHGQQPFPQCGATSGGRVTFHVRAEERKESNPKPSSATTAVRNCVIAGANVQLRQLPYTSFGIQIDQGAARARFERQSFRGGNAF
jgi:hypothetical protein